MESVGYVMIRRERVSDTDVAIVTNKKHHPRGCPPLFIADTGKSKSEAEPNSEGQMAEGKAKKTSDGESKRKSNSMTGLFGLDDQPSLIDVFP